MNILIVGAGEVGAYLAKILSKEKNEITVIDIDPDKLQNLRDTLEAQTVEGYGSNVITLQEAGADKADLLLALTNNDETNMLISLLGKGLGAKRSIVRIKKQKLWGKKRYFYRKNIKADLILNSVELVSLEIQKIIREHKGIDIESFADGKILIRNIIIDKESSFTEKNLSSLSLPPATLVSLIIRKESFIIPRGDTVLKEGDHILVLGKPEGIEQFENLTDGSSKEIKNVVILGGGEIGLSLARSLERTKINVKLIENSKLRAKELAALLSESAVIHGDGTNLELLKEQRVGNADAFVSVCNQDEINLMSCQLAKELGVKKLVALTKKPDYTPIYKSLGIDAPISPRLLMAQSILEFVKSGSFSQLAIIEEGMVEILEMEVLPWTKIRGQKVKDAGFPKSSMVAAVLRNGDMLVPKGDFELKASDVLIIFTLVSEIPELEKLFRSSKDSN